MSLEKNEYATKDLHLASFLKIKGMELKRLEKFGKGRRGESPAYFVFDNLTRCEELENIFWEGLGSDIVVNAKDFVVTIRDLRSRVFSIISPERI